jgi:uncharacterized protein YbjT (DUF2867 family)
MILITGATGNVGRPLVTALLADGAPVRALTRDPAGADLPEGTEVARFDPGQPDTITAAMTGVTRLFINITAVGAVLGDLMTAASRAGVGRVVLLSSLTVSDDGVQPYTIGAHHKAVEDAVAASVAEWTFLRCGMFAVNTRDWWGPMIRTSDVVRIPYPEAATAPIAARDIADTAALVLLGEGHAGARYVLTGPQSLTQAGQVAAIGAAIGRDVRVDELPPDVFRAAASKFMPPNAADDLLRYLAGYVGRPAQMSPDLEKLTGRPGTMFAEWAREHAASFR